MPAEEVVRARIDREVKREAMAVLATMGLSMSDAIRLMLVRVARDKTLPFEVGTPNATSRETFADTDRGEGLTHCRDVGEMFERLGQNGRCP